MQLFSHRQSQIISTARKGVHNGHHRTGARTARVRAARERGRGVLAARDAADDQDQPRRHRRRLRPGRDRRARGRRLTLARPSRRRRMVLRPRGRAHRLGRRHPPLPEGRLVRASVPKACRTPSTPRQAAPGRWSASHRCSSKDSSAKSANPPPNASYRRRARATRTSRGSPRSPSETASKSSAPQAHPPATEPTNTDGVGPLAGRTGPLPNPPVRSAPLLYAGASPT